MRGLIVREPWATLIVEGKKTWEIRRTRTKIRGQIAIISGGRILGTVEISDVIEMPVKEAAAHVEKHYADPLFVLAYGKGKSTIFAWILSRARKLKRPIRIDIPRGAQTWVKLPKEMEDKVWKSLEES